MKSGEGFELFQRKFCKPADGPALVVGSKIYGGKLDRRTLYENAEGVDLFEGEGVDRVVDMERQDAELGQYAHIDCCSVLEHVKRPWLMAETIERVLRPGGTLLVLVPFVWRVHAYPDDYWRMTPNALDVIFPSIHWTAKSYIVSDQIRKRVPSLKPGKWLGRAEVAAFGVKCG